LLNEIDFLETRITTNYLRVAQHNRW